MLFVCGCRFFGAVVLVSGPVAGLLGRAAAFRGLVFLVKLLLCLLCVAAIFCYCAVGFCSGPVIGLPGLLCFVKLDFLNV